LLYFNVLAALQLSNFNHVLQSEVHYGGEETSKKGKKKKAGGGKGR
jgi:hypothetical protein